MIEIERMKSFKGQSENECESCRSLKKVMGQLSNPNQMSMAAKACPSLSACHCTGVIAITCSIVILWKNSTRSLFRFLAGMRGTTWGGMAATKLCFCPCFEGVSMSNSFTLKAAANQFQTNQRCHPKWIIAVLT